jgi:hypothetical protein
MCDMSRYRKRLTTISPVTQKDESMCGPEEQNFDISVSAAVIVGTHREPTRGMSRSVLRRGAVQNA